MFMNVETEVTSVKKKPETLEELKEKLKRQVEKKTMVSRI